MHLIVLHNVGKFQSPGSNTFEILITCVLSSIFGQVRMDRLQTESDAYEPIVQSAQVGSIKAYICN